MEKVAFKRGSCKKLYFSHLAAVFFLQKAAFDVFKRE